MNLAEALREAADILENIGKEKNAALPAYKLKKQLCDLPPGTVFVHDRDDDKVGSPALGCMKLAWNNGDCQESYCGGTFILPGQEAENEEWFTRIQNDGRYTV